MIFCTLASSSKDHVDYKYIPDDTFDVVIVDEASQAMEPATWIVIPQAKKLILAGDIHQLPAVILSQKAKDNGFGESLMERMMKMYKDDEACYVDLSQQYRMNSNIMKWSNQFYNNRVTSHYSNANILLEDLPGVSRNELTGNSRNNLLYSYL